MKSIFKYQISFFRSLQQRTFNSRGQINYLIPVVFIFVIVLAGVGYVIYSQADRVTPTGLIIGVSGKCLTNQNGDTENTNPVVVSPCVHSKSQIWTVAGNGSLQVQGHCLDVDDSGTTPDTSVRLYQCNNTRAQVWSLNAANQLVNPHSELCLGIDHFFTRSTNIVDLQECRNSPGQTWQLPSANNPSGPNPTPTQKQHTGPPISPVQPLLVNHQLVLGNTGSPLKLRGVTVWGIEDEITQSFGVNEYTDRQTVVNTIKAWGGNIIRLRVLASDYNNQTYMSKLQYLQEIKDWQTTAQSAGLYLQVTWWDSLDGNYNDANWASDYSQVFPMMGAVVSKLGASNPYVIYEPFNEPNNVTESQWLSAMEATEQQFRSDGYNGLLILDTNNYAHQYNDADMTALENNDAKLAGMHGKNQICFAKHDYAPDYSNPNVWTATTWTTNDYGGSPWNFTNHCIIETEFGNYNGSPSTIHPSWSQSAASGMASELNNGNLQGAEAFLFGPWYDANAMTINDNSTPTQWGGYVKNDFLEAVH